MMVSKLEKKKIELKIAQGTIIGREEHLPNGGLMSVFKGIPYAQPPIGDLRFEVIWFNFLFSLFGFSNKQ